MHAFLFLITYCSFCYLTVYEPDELMPYYLDRIATVIRPVIEKRSYRMFGHFLTSDELINC